MSSLSARFDCRVVGGVICKEQAPLCVGLDIMGEAPCPEKLAVHVRLDGDDAALALGLDALLRFGEPVAESFGQLFAVEHERARCRVVVRGVPDETNVCGFEHGGAPQGRADVGISMLPAPLRASQAMEAM